MSTLRYLGPPASNDRDITVCSYVTDVLAAANLSSAAVDALITSGYANYATKTYVDNQDALNATKTYVDNADATRLHLSQINVDSGIAGLDSTGRVGVARVQIPSTQRWPKPFFSPVNYVQTIRVVTQTTAGTYSWICPDGVTTVMVECWGAGGAGAGRTTNGGGGGGGGGEYAREDAYEVTAGTVYAYTVGAAGAAGVNGGASSFNISGVSAQGGTSVAANVATGAAGGSGSINAVHHDGGTGANGTGSAGGGGGGSAGTGLRGNNATSATGATAVAGGGAGGNGASAQGNGTAGAAPGGGGGGALRTSSGSPTGGAGAPGKVVLTYAEPGSATSSTAETTLTTMTVADPGFTYKLMCFGQIMGQVSLDTGEYPLVYVRTGSSTGQVIAWGAGTAEYYQSSTPGAVSSQATFSTPFAAPAAWAAITGWTAVNTGGYTSTLSGNNLEMLASEPVTMSASVSFTGGVAGIKAAISTAIRIVDGAGTVIATGAQVDGAAGTATVTWTGTVTLGQLYGIQIAQTGSATPGTPSSVTNGTFTVGSGMSETNIGPVPIMPLPLSVQSTHTGDTTVYMQLLRSGAASTVTATAIRPNVWVCPIPA